MTFVIFLALLQAQSPGTWAGNKLISRQSSEAVTAVFQEQNFSCLPGNVRGDEILSYSLKGTPRLTVDQKLMALKARCRKGKLVDRKAREIRFFRPSCWGNPPPDYLEIRVRENSELEKLRRRFTMVVFDCNPMVQ